MNLEFKSVKTRISDDLDPQIVIHMKDESGGKHEMVFTLGNEFSDDLAAFIKSTTSRRIEVVKQVSEIKSNISKGITEFRINELKKKYECS